MKISDAWKIAGLFLFAITGVGLVGDVLLDWPAVPPTLPVIGMVCLLRGELLQHRETVGELAALLARYIRAQDRP